MRFSGNFYQVSNNLKLSASYCRDIVHAVVILTGKKGFGQLKTFRVRIKRIQGTLIDLDRVDDAPVQAPLHAEVGEDLIDQFAIRHAVADIA